MDVGYWTARAIVAVAVALAAAKAVAQVVAVVCGEWRVAGGVFLVVGARSRTAGGGCACWVVNGES